MELQTYKKRLMEQGKRKDFTLEYYKEFVCSLKRDYTFTTFQEGKENKSSSPQAIMRHDLDMDLAAGLRLSLIEKELGIHATYFFMLRCPLYNLFSIEGAEQVHQILQGGHHMGLHFDCSIYKDISADKLNYYVSKECVQLEQFFGYPVEAISFHRPGPLELSGVELAKWPHTYEKVFLDRFKYFSDSRGVWSYGNPLESEAFLKRENLHILVHPVWWTAAPTTPYDCLIGLVQQIDHRTEQYLSKNCQAWDEGKQQRK